MFESTSKGNEPNAKSKDDARSLYMSSIVAIGVMVDWWVPETKGHYVKKTQCGIDLVKNYTIEVQGEDLHLKWINTHKANRAYNRVVPWSRWRSAGLSSVCLTPVVVCQARLQEPGHALPEGGWP